MTAETIFIFISFCGFVGLFLKRNLLNTICSLMQSAMGLCSLLIIIRNQSGGEWFSLLLFWIFFLGLTIFMYCLAILLIRRRSTLQVDEVTELRG
jgi:NADH:ubiquinone oxidoreductase subunit K